MRQRSHTRAVAVGHELHAECGTWDGGHIDLRERVHVHLLQRLAVRVALAVALDAPEPLRERVDLRPIIRVRVRARAGAGAGAETGAGVGVGTGAGVRVGAGDGVRAGVDAGGNRSPYYARWDARVQLGGLLRNMLTALTQYSLVYADD